MHQPKPTGICTSLKSDFYFWLHSPLNKKSALLNFICIWDLVLICWKMWWPEPESCWNPNPHTIGKLLPVCLTNNRSPIDHISERHAKFGENRWRIVDLIPNWIQIRNLHISKIRFLFPVSFTIEYKVAIAEFLSVFATWCWSLEKCGLQSLKTAKIGIHTPLKSAKYFRFLSQTIGDEATTFLRCMQNFMKICKELWT